MPKLADIQDQIFSSLISTQMGDLSFIKQTNEIAAHERLLVHRNTILENFVESLKISYPGTWQLLGEDCARGVALSYAHVLSNITGRDKINQFGANFPNHLSSFPSTRHLAYLPDFAKLEWLRNMSFDAPKEISIDVHELTKIDFESLEKHRLVFNSSVFFMKSDFPLSQIQALIDNKDIDKLNMTNDACYIVIYRLDNKVNTAWLGVGDWHFLSLLFEGKVMSEALIICKKMKMQIDLQGMFEFILAKEMLVELKL
jgi:hypothetical protein